MPHFQLSQCAQSCVAPQFQPLATIELGDEREEAIVRGVQVPGQLEDLILELVRRANVGAAFFEGRE